MQVTLLLWITSLVPIALLILLLTVGKRGVVEAAGLGLGFVALSAIFIYKGNIKLVISEGLKGVWSALMIIYIIWAAILLYQTGEKAGAFNVIKNSMRRMLPNELLMILAMGWILESFLQGITGFGVPVAVGAPLLIAVGVNPIYAVVIPLLGQSWGNTFGTLAAGWDALAMAAEQTAGSPDFLTTALWTSIFLMIWNFVAGIMICFMYGRMKGIIKGLPAVLILGTVQGLGEILLSQVNTTLCCFIPAVISLIVILLMGKTPWYKDEWKMADSPLMRRSAKEEALKKTAQAEKNQAKTNQTGNAPAGGAKKQAQKAENKGQAVPDMNFLQAFMPYIVLSVVTLVVLLAAPVKAFLGQFSIGFAFPETSTGYGYVNAAVDCFSAWSPLTHAGTFLLIAAVVGIIYYRSKGWLTDQTMKAAIHDSFTMVKNSAIATAEMVAMAKIMSGSGQTEVLAQGIANVMGGTYFIFAPAVGYLGTFITGSNVNSNVLFGSFQKLTANLLNANADMVLAGSTTGASVGSAVSPAKIVLGAATAGVEGKEGDVLKIMLMITLPFVIIMGIFLFVMLKF